MVDETVAHEPVAHTSIEKVAAFAQHQAERAGGDMVGAASKALLPELLRRLPSDPEVLDAELVSYAQLCLALRSDSAPALRLVDVDGQDVPVPEP